MSIEPGDGERLEERLLPLIRAVFGEPGFRLLDDGVAVASVAFEGEARALSLGWPWRLEVPAHLPRTDAEVGLVALLARRAQAQVELEFDAQGICVSVGGPTGDLLGLPADHLRGAPVEAWLRRVHPFEQAVVRQAVLDGASTRSIVRLRLGGGVIRHVDFVLRPLAGGTLVCLRDVSDVESLRAELEASTRREHALLGAQPDTLLRVRGDGRILEVRPGRDGLPDGLMTSGAGSRIGDALVEPHGRQIERRLARVIADREPAVLCMQLGSVWWEARIEAADDGQGLMLLRDVSARQRLLRELVEARERAESASREKSRFLANMSHEIRTPLHGVLGLTDLLKHTRLNEEQSELATAIEGSGQLLLSLLNDLLDFSRMEAGQLQLECCLFDLVELLEETLEIAAPTAHAKGVLVLLDVDPDLPVVAHGDPKRLRQVVLNLVSNAVKFTSKGYVLVRVRAFGDSRIQVEVEDTGIGIAADAVKHLFDPFAQADASVARRFGGTGLGLAICRELVGRMEGTIAVESEPGRGSTFRFDVHLDLREGRRGDDRAPLHDLAGRSVYVHGAHPIAYNALAALLRSWGARLVDGATEAEVVLVDAMGEDAPTGIADHPAVVRIIPWGVPRGELTVRHPPRREALLRTMRFSLGLESPRDRAEAGALASLDGQVLVVDDHPVNRRITKAQLERLGLSVVLASGGREGLRLAQQHSVDLILMDVQMPDMDGYTAARLIRERGVDVPIVALTAGVEEQRQRCIEAGMDAQLGKPLDLSRLRSVLHSCLDASRGGRRSA